MPYNFDVPSQHELRDQMIGMNEMAATSDFDHADMTNPTAMPLAEDRIRSGHS